MKRLLIKMLIRLWEITRFQGQKSNRNCPGKSGDRGGYAGVEGVASTSQFPTLHTKTQKGVSSYDVVWNEYVGRIELGYLMGRNGMEFIRRGLRGELSAEELSASGLNAESYRMALLAMREGERVYRSELLLMFQGRGAVC